MLSREELEENATFIVAAMEQTMNNEINNRTTEDIDQLKLKMAAFVYFKSLCEQMCEKLGVKL